MCAGLSVEASFHECPFSRCVSLTAKTSQHNVTMRDQKHLIWALCAMSSTHYMTNKNFKFKFGKEKNVNKYTIHYES